MEVLEINIAKSLFIILLVLSYWKFVYYKYHKGAGGVINFSFLIGIFSIIGGYALLISQSITFSDYRVLFFACSAMYFFSTIFVVIASEKHHLTSGIEITYSWIDKKLGRFFTILTAILIYPLLFFTVAGARFVFGREDIIIWIMIFLAWIKSDIRLISRYVLK